MTDQNQINDAQTTAMNNLMSELGLSDLPEDKQQELMIKMTEVVLKRIFVETMDKLTEQDRSQYEAMLDAQAQPEDVEQFLRGKIGDYDQLVQKVVAEFKEEMKAAHE